MISLSEIILTSCCQCYPCTLSTYKGKESTPRYLNIDKPDDKVGQQDKKVTFNKETDLETLPDPIQQSNTEKGHDTHHQPSNDKALNGHSKLKHLSNPTGDSNDISSETSTDASTDISIQSIDSVEELIRVRPGSSSSRNDHQGDNSNNSSDTLEDSHEQCSSPTIDSQDLQDDEVKSERESSILDNLDAKGEPYSSVSHYLNLNPRQRRILRDKMFTLQRKLATEEARKRNMPRELPKLPKTSLTYFSNNRDTPIDNNANSKMKVLPRTKIIRDKALAGDDKAHTRDNSRDKAPKTRIDRDRIFAMKRKKAIEEARNRDKYPALKPLPSISRRNKTNTRTESVLKSYIRGDETNTTTVNNRKYSYYIEKNNTKLTLHERMKRDRDLMYARINRDREIALQHKEEIEVPRNEQGPKTSPRKQTHRYMYFENELMKQASSKAPTPSRIDLLYHLGKLKQRADLARGKGIHCVPE